MTEGCSEGRGDERSLRRQVFEALECSAASASIGYFTDVGLIALVLANVLAVILESVHSVYWVHQHFFEAFELFSVVAVSLKNLLRLWAAADRPEPAGAPVWRKRFRYVCSPLALADLAAILPFYLSAIFALDLRFLRVLRLLRVFKLTRYSGAMRVLLEVLHNERRAFGAALAILLMIMTFAASGIYLVEHEAQPEAFGSIPASMWWAVAALTTVGYGDVTPITPLGRIFASAITIVGVGMVALPAGVLASGFTAVHDRNRRRLEQEAGDVLEDGVITDEESERYAALAEELGVPAEIAEQIVTSARRGVPLVHLPESCPHCGKSLEDG
jgi:voltage-gated potassium channel